MDVRVSDTEEGLNQHVMSDDGDAEPSSGGEANNTENSLAHDEVGISDPYVGMEFDSEHVAKTYYDDYARRMGFSIKAGQSTRSKMGGIIVAREFVCGREGLKRRSSESCDALLRIEFKGSKWVVTKFVKEHSHSIVENSLAHDEVGISDPYVGMEFDSEHIAKTYYDEYARQMGFSIKAGQSTQSKMGGIIVAREFVCGREGLKCRSSESCDALLRIEFKGAKWVVTKFVKEHSHSMVENSVAHDEVGISDPYVGMEFGSEDGAKTYYDEYARRMGFSFKVGRSTRSKMGGIIVAREFVCGREGLKRRSSERCDALLRIEFKGSKWVVTKFKKEHSHSLVNPSKVHYLRPRRHFAGDAKTMADTYQGGEFVPSGVMYVSMDGNRVPTDANNRSTGNTPAEANRLVQNFGTVNYAVRPCNRKKTLGRDAQNLLDYFKKMQAENPGFFYAILLDDDNCMANVFWADARSRTAYMHFGDAVILDTSYKVNQYRVPFAPFTGVNHHGQTILFGCALLLDDSEATFLWLFKTFLTAMNDRQPVSLITDQDRAIQTAVSQVFPGVRHCINKWCVLREGPEKLAHVCHLHPNFQVELFNCINLTVTIEEFELSWSSILEKYDLKGHDWLQSLYNARAQWVPVYFRDSFFAVISPNQGFDGYFLDGYVNQQTTIPMFFRAYERAIENWFEREIEADHDTICTTPVLRTPSPMEKQAANLYTRKIFTKFQEELVETFVYTANRIEGDGAIGTFRVAKFEDDNKAYMVSLNFPEMRANCSCQMFEYSGILCRHVLTVFTVTNVLTLPPHYILKRWTRNAKSGVETDDRGSELHVQENLTVRYNRLCREAIKYAEEGATATETYNVAMGALREGWKKVAVVRKNVAKVSPPSSQAIVTYHDDKKSSMPAPDAAPLLWPQQDEVTQRFNLNDTSAPTQSISDLNLPRMAPVSLHRDDGHSESMLVLPCLKSMTWVMENKNSTLGNKVAVMNLKLQDYSKNPSADMEVKFQLSRITLEPMLKSMAKINEQLSTPANKVAVINLKLQDTETITGESDVKFQVSRDTLGAMLRSMAYIREQLSIVTEPQAEPLPKKHKK